MAVEIATFAGGCFWCMEPPFADLNGILSVRPGYMGGEVKYPTYEQICTGRTGHAEVIQINFDSDTISYEALLEVFWRQIDPTTENQQFADRGTQYRTAIFYHNLNQKELAFNSLRYHEDRKTFGPRPIVTQIVPAAEFYPAEDEHHQYYLKNPFHYARYKEGSGRAGYLQSLWANQKQKK